MLLDPIYAVKADEHSGGVGTETQIISAKVYNEVTQDKFIPVVMKRDNEGTVCKPTYLQGRLHFDLSIPEKYEETYCRLVKKLYGEEVYVKPDLGKKPSWVEKPFTPEVKTIIAYESLKGVLPTNMKNESLISFLSEISSGLIKYAKKGDNLKFDPEEYINKYDETEIYRTQFLQLLKNAVYVEISNRYIADFLEEINNRLPQNSIYSNIVKIRIHELFLYVIAYQMRVRDYSAAGYFLGRTYFGNRYLNKYGTENYTMFYSGQDHHL